MAYIADSVLDGGLDYATTNGSRIDICSTEPTNYAEVSTYSLGNKTGLTVGAAQDDTSGRMVQVPAFTDGTITATGTAGYWALTDGSGELLAANNLSVSRDVAPVFGNTFGLGAFDINILDGVTESELTAGVATLLTLPAFDGTTGLVSLSQWEDARDTIAYPLSHDGRFLAVAADAPLYEGARNESGTYYTTDDSGNLMRAVREYEDVIVCGDSTVASSAGHAYLANIMDSTVTDGGVGGDTLAKMDDRFVVDVIMQEPGAVFIQGGVNDCNSVRTLEQMQASMQSMVAKAEAGGIGSDVITNGDFTTNITGWTQTDGASILTHDSGTLKIENGDASNAGAYQAITTVIGTQYTVLFTMPADSGNSGFIAIGTSAGSGDLVSQGPGGNDPTSAIFTAVGTTTYITFKTGGSTGAWSKWDDVVCKAVLTGTDPIKIVLGNVGPWAGHSGWDASEQTKTDAYNSWLAGYAAANGYPLLDIYTLLEDPGNPDELLAAYDSGDGMHYSDPIGDLKVAAGYAALLRFDRILEWKHYHASRSDIKYSNDFSSWSTHSVTVADTVDDSAIEDVVWQKVQCTSGTALHYINITANTSGATIGERQTQCFIVKKGSGVNWCWIFGYGLSNAVAYFDLTNGVIGTVSGTATPLGSIKAIAEDTYLLTLSWLAVSNSDGIGFGLTNADNVSSYYDDGLSYHYVCHAQKEPGSVFTHPIKVPSTTSVVMPTCLMRYPFSVAVFDQASGFAYIDVTPETAQASLTATDEGVLSVADSATNLMFVDSGGVKSTDGTGTAVVDPTFTAGQKYRFLCYWDTALDVLGVGVRTMPGGSFSWNETTYDDAFAAGSWFNLMFGNTHNYSIHDATIYDAHETQSYYEVNY